MSQSLPEEFGITPVRGYRSWAVSPANHLMSVNFAFVWNKEVVSADCAYCSDPPSKERHDRYGRGCGIYAMHRPEPLHAITWRAIYAPPIWGAVEGWGRVIWHRDGWRAQFARVLALVLTDDISATISKAYGIPCLPVGEFISTYPPEVPWRFR